MEENKKNPTPKIRFAKIHERIQNKYAQMQKRIEKSRSMESISTLSDEFNFERQSSSTVSENCDDEEFEKVNIEKKPLRFRVIVENINKQKAIAKYINKQETEYYDSEKFVIYESTAATPKIQDDDDEFINTNFCLSLENVHKDSTEGFHEELAPPMLTQKTSLRDRITAVRERRKEQKEKKKEEKKNKVECESPDKIILSNKPGLDSLKKKNKVASVSVALIEATGPENDSALDEKARQLYCRLRLGQEKYKSKSVKTNGNSALWQELFDFSLFEDNFLEITVWDKEKDTFVGRITLDVTDFEHDKTYKMKLNLEEAEVMTQITTLITVSGTAVNTVDAHDNERIQNEISKLDKNISLLLLTDEFEEVGSLTVVVHEAKGLAASDCFVSILLGNDRVQTHVVHKTNNPSWMKSYNLTVKDSTSVLRLTIHDEKKSDIVGKLAIPLLNIINGERKWYALKDTTMRDRAKGQNPSICLEMYFYFDLVKSSLRVINPKERILLETSPEFRRHLLTKNITRAKVIIDWITAVVKDFKQLFEWESKKKNFIAITGWLIFWWIFQAWMLPLLVLVPFSWSKYLAVVMPGEPWRRRLSKSFSLNDYDMRTERISNSSVSSKDSRTSIRQRIQSVQDMVTTVQNSIGSAASLGESVKNLFNFTVPYLSFLAIFMILVVSVVLFFIPCRVIIMAWGVHKYLRKILRPNRIPNNEILDLLSRVPDDEELLDFKELPDLDSDVPATSKTKGTST